MITNFEIVISEHKFYNIFQQLRLLLPKRNQSAIFSARFVSRKIDFFYKNRFAKLVFTHSLLWKYL